LNLLSIFFLLDVTFQKKMIFKNKNIKN